ncbi:MAG: sulfurtransferase complex subunit TusB [Halioglobus sp.]|nr:sulfurtransferase complex subunit TusB [Halioglobus sp.]
MLHTLNATPASAAAEDCLRLLRAQDALLLLGDGVYAAVAGSDMAAALAGSGAELYILADDAATAGVVADEKFQRIDMAGFVTLTERCARHMAWH